MTLGIRRILVSQPKPAFEKSPYFDLAKKYNLKIDFHPLFEIRTLALRDFRRQQVNILDYSAVIFTARTAIDHFFKLCEATHVSVPESMNYFCMTEPIAMYLQKYITYRKRKVFFGDLGKKGDLMTVISKHAKEKFLVPVSDVPKDAFFAKLDAKKLDYTKAVMFHLVTNEFPKDSKFNYNILLFFSPSDVSSLLKNFPAFEQGNIRIGCFGVTTAQAIREAGLHPDFEAPTSEAPSMTTALELYLKQETASLRREKRRQQPPDTAK